MSIYVECDICGDDEEIDDVDDLPGWGDTFVCEDCEGDVGEFWPDL